MTTESKYSDKVQNPYSTGVICCSNTGVVGMIVYSCCSKDIALQPR